MTEARSFLRRVRERLGDGGESFRALVGLVSDPAVCEAVGAELAALARHAEQEGYRRGMERAVELARSRCRACPSLSGTAFCHDLVVAAIQREIEGLPPA